LRKDPALKLDIEKEASARNQFGIYHHTYRTRGANRSHCYYFCDPDHKECVKSPPIGRVWYDTMPELIDEIDVSLDSNSCGRGGEAAGIRQSC
jgi:hypothetical protein